MSNRTRVGLTPISPKLLHQVFDGRKYGVGPDLVALRRRMKSIGHDFSRDNSIDEELVADIHVEHLLVVRKLRQACVDRLDYGIHDGRLLRSTRVVARENTQYKDLRLRLLLLEFFDNQAISFDDLTYRIGCGVVRAEHQNDQLRLEAFEFAILHPPEHTLGCIACDRKVGSFE